MTPNDIILVRKKSNQKPIRIRRFQFRENLYEHIPEEPKTETEQVAEIKQESQDHIGEPQKELEVLKEKGWRNLNKIEKSQYQMLKKLIES